jgi:hypothetical protein
LWQSSLDLCLLGCCFCMICFAVCVPAFARWLQHISAYPSTESTTSSYAPCSSCRYGDSFKERPFGSAEVIKASAVADYGQLICLPARACCAFVCCASQGCVGVSFDKAGRLLWHMPEQLQLLFPSVD